MLLLDDLAETVLPEDEILDPVNQTIEVATHPKHMIFSVIDRFFNQVLKVLEYHPIDCPSSDNTIGIHRFLEYALSESM